jgi:hypothetical protein
MHTLEPNSDQDVISENGFGRNDIAVRKVARCSASSR